MKVVLKKSDSVQISLGIVLYKLISGIIELALGLSIILFGNNIVEIYSHYKVRELLEDPHDLLIRTVSVITPFVIQHRMYIVTLLLLLGIVKIIGAIGLLRNKEWGLDLLILLFIVMLPFDLYELFVHITLLKIGYFLINLLITFYLIGFKPHKHLQRWKKYVLNIFQSHK